MARDLPPPLPPAERTVGQLVAETLRAYGNHFLRALPLGIPLAAVDAATHVQSRVPTELLVVAAAPALSAAYAAACALVAPERVRARAFVVAVVAGTLVLLPAALLLTWFALLAAAYLAFVGLVVPVAAIEGRGPLDAFRRAGDLARADYVHALGSLAALAIVFYLSRLALIALLQGQADNTIRAAAVIADVFLAPILFLGPALLYFDQAARVGSRRPRRRSRDADLHSPLDADAAGRSDPQVEP